MPLLQKEILPVGTFLVGSPNGRIPKVFDKTDLELIASTGNRMIAKGLNIPAPFAHNRAAVPVMNVPEASPFNNAGYWKKFFVATNKDNVPTLHGIVDVPGSESEPDTPYYKAKNTAKEVSISLSDKFVDGTGIEWNNVPMHVALVNTPVVTNQTEFKDVPDDSLVVNMSMLESEESDATLIGSLRSVLAEALQVVIPDSTMTPKQFLRDLLVAVSQIKANPRSQGQTLEPVPIYLSIGEDDVSFSKDQAEAIVASKAINPVTKVPFTMEDLGFKPAGRVDLSVELKERDDKIAGLTNMLRMFSNKLVSDVKARTKDRIDNLVAKGVITREMADTTLVPKLDFSLSITKDTNELEPHPLDITLSALEKVAPPVHRGTVHEAPLSDDGNFDSKQLDELIASFGQYVAN